MRCSGPVLIQEIAGTDAAAARARRRSATVKAHYEEKGGEKVVTQIEVKPRQQSPGTK